MGKHCKQGQNENPLKDRKLQTPYRVPQHIPIQPIYSERKNVAAFCASVDLLAGSNNNASCNGLPWLERVADCSKVCEDVARLIYLYLDKHKHSWNFDSISLLRKQVSSGLFINRQ